jgi:hypothetical protein
VATAQRNPDRGLTAAGLSLRHLLLGYRALVLAELLFELKVRTSRGISNVLRHPTLLSIRLAA